MRIKFPPPLAPAVPRQVHATQIALLGNDELPHPICEHTDG
jgi:hypothetical protein